MEDFGLARRVADLETLVEATGLDRFAMLGMSGGAPVALAYADAHPERVTRMVLYGGMASRGLAQEDDAAEEALLSMIRAGWARPDPLFRRLFTTAFIPDVTEEQMQWIDELQRTSTNTENAVNSRIARGKIDVTGLLPNIGVPTLVLHALGDRMAPGWGPRLASGIADARLVMLDSRNHVLLADEPAWGVFRREVADFLADDHAPPPVTNLSDRERQILLLAAEGLDNTEIAERLTLSVRTVERHFQNIYLKLGLSGRTARAAAVARMLA